MCSEQVVQVRPGVRAVVISCCSVRPMCAADCAHRGVQGLQEVRRGEASEQLPTQQADQRRPAQLLQVSTDALPCSVLPSVHPRQCHQTLAHPYVKFNGPEDKKSALKLLMAVFPAILICGPSAHQCLSELCTHSVLVLPTLNLLESFRAQSQYQENVWLCRRCKLNMDSVSREKRKRIDNHAVRRTAPAPSEAIGHVGHSALPSPANALHHLQQLPLQHYCDSCKTLCAAQEHAEGDELPTSMHCPACGSVALPIDPNVVRKGDPARSASHTGFLGTSSEKFEVDLKRCFCNSLHSRCHMHLYGSYCSAIQDSNVAAVNRHGESKQCWCSALMCLVMAAAAGICCTDAAARVCPPCRPCCPADCRDASYQCLGCRQNGVPIAGRHKCSHLFHIALLRYSGQLAAGHIARSFHDGCRVHACCL